MTRPALIVHERLAHWARRLRPRVAGWPVRLVETRSSMDLERAWRDAAYPLVVIDLDRWPRRGLSDLVRAWPPNSEALVMVLDPGGHPEVRQLAREIGAAYTFSGVATPPAVVALLGRWLEIARRRAGAIGWTRDQEPEPEFWEALVPRATTAIPR